MEPGAHTHTLSGGNVLTETDRGNWFGLFSLLSPACRFVSRYITWPLRQSSRRIISTLASSPVLEKPFDVLQRGNMQQRSDLMTYTHSLRWRLVEINIH